MLLDQTAPELIQPALSRSDLAARSAHQRRSLALDPYQLALGALECGNQRL
jgi:hypothetical protein